MASREFEMGSISGLPEFRVVMDESGWLPTPIVEIRKTTLKAFVSIERADDIDEQTWRAFVESVMFATTGAVIAGLIPGGIAAIPTFMQIFGTCATSKGLDLVGKQIRLQTETVYSEWERFA